MGEDDPYKRRHDAAPIVSEADRRLADEYHELRLASAMGALLPKAKDGERWAALRLIELCSDAILERSPLPQQLATWLAEGLLHLARGDTVEQAFSIPLRLQGEDKEGRAALDGERRFLLAYQAACVILIDNEKQLYAFKKVGEENGVSDETVRKAWREFRPTVEREIALQQQYLGRVFRI